MRRSLVLTLLALTALAASATSALAATTTRTVPGELRFEYGASPNDPGNCSAIVFIRWAHVPGTTAATVHYRWRDKEYSKAGAPPFDDHYEWVRSYDVEPGYHWIQVGKGWADGPTPNDCRESSEKQKVDYDHDPAATRVELTIEESAECAQAKQVLETRKRQVRHAQARVRTAKPGRARKRARAQLRRAKVRRGKAQARVNQLC